MRHIREVMGYNLSNNIKVAAIHEAIHDSTSRLMTGGERDVFFDNFWNDYNNHADALIREAERTLISRVNLESFEVTSGFVPGRITDRFAMDENNGYLRVVSVVGSWWWTPNSTHHSVVSVLDAEMQTVGMLDNVARGEWLQTTRFIGNTLYLMTWAENDPFILIDLSIPEDPAVLGQMRLNGMYNYIHPISDTLILGIGHSGDWRDWRTKLALYDVSNPNRPVELDIFYFNPDEFVSVHDFHRFTWNAERELMIIAGHDTAYVFEIKNDQINLVKEDTHRDGWVVRSVYIDNYLYVFSNVGIHIWNMDTWQRVNTISIEQPVFPDDGQIIFPIRPLPAVVQPVVALA
jgi:inhibitor of cysteine peptidase